MEPAAILIENVTKRFGAHAAVSDLTLEVPRGSVFGLLGQNGAGKSTTLKMLLNLLQPSSGRLRVLGMDSVEDSVRIRQRAGYLPEHPCYYGWMTVDEAIRFNASFYATWDRDLAARLLVDLGLPPGRRLRDLSRGMQAKVGLVMALGSRPDVLLLDDPTSGLDPVVRREFLEAMIANVHAEGGTVLFSSHLLHEMERVADEVAILHEGRLRARGPLDRLKAQTRALRAVYPGTPPDGVTLPGMVRSERGAHHLSFTVTDYHPALHEALRGTGAESVEVNDLSLEEIFVATVKGGVA